MVADERAELEKKPLATLGATSSDQMENTHYIHDKQVRARFHHARPARQTPSAPASIPSFTAKRVFALSWPQCARLSRLHSR